VIRVALLLALFGTGCARHSCDHFERDLPVHADATTDMARKTVVDNLAAVKTIESTCTIRLIRADGKEIQLEGAIVAKPPSHFRLQMWKLGRTVFDLTITPDGVWMLKSKKMNAGAQPGISGSANWQGLSRGWESLSESFFNNAQVTQTNDLFEFVQKHEKATITCTVDDRKLVVRTVTILNKQNQTSHTLSMNCYRLLDDVAWPARLSIASDGNEIIITSRDLTLNEELAEAAFWPPRKATQIDRGDE
jgi:outer membrane lipoprotein-sorting protein